MAYIHKITMYLVDPNGETEDYDDLEDIMACCCHPKIIKQETKKFEWDDNVPVNYINATKKEYDDFFNSVEEI